MKAVHESAEAPLWRNRDFMFLLVVRGALLSAVQIISVAVSWRIYEVSGSALTLGLAALWQFLPVLFFAPLGGSLADVLDRRKVIAASSLCGAALTACLSGVDHDVGLTMALLALISVTRILALPSSISFLPFLVEPQKLEPAVAIGATVNKCALVGGPMAGGLLLLGGVDAAYFAAASLLLGAACIAAMIRSSHVARGSLRSGFGFFDGFRFIGRRRTLLGVISLDLLAGLLGGVTALLPVYVRDILGGGPDLLGLLRAAPAIGGVAAALVLARVSLGKRAGAVMLLATAAFGAFTLVFGLSRSVILSLAALGLLGAMDTVASIVRQTAIQLVTPNGVRGRVAAVSSTCLHASILLGQFESGVVAALIGATGSVIFGGVGAIAVVALWAWAFPELRRLDFSPGALSMAKSAQAPAAGPDPSVDPR